MAGSDNAPCFTRAGDCSSAAEPLLNRSEFRRSGFGAAAPIASDARAMALRIRGPAPQRQIFGSAAISASVGRGLALSRAAMAMIMPGSQ